MGTVHGDMVEHVLGVAQGQRLQCITIASESAPSDKKTSPPVSACGTPAPPVDAKLAAGRAEVETGFPLRKNRSFFV